MTCTKSGITAIHNAFDGCCDSPTRKAYIEFGARGRTRPENGKGKTRQLPAPPRPQGDAARRRGDAPRLFHNAKSLRPLASQYSQCRFGQSALSVQSSGRHAAQTVAQQ